MNENEYTDLSVQQKSAFERLSSIESYLQCLCDDLKIGMNSDLEQDFEFLYNIIQGYMK